VCTNRSVMPAGASSTTANRRSSVPPSSITGTIRTAAMKAGNRMVPSTKPRVLTRSRNSRRRMSMISDMGRLLAAVRNGRVAHVGHEDLVQRRLDALEAVQRNGQARQLGQQLAGRVAGRQLDLPQLLAPPRRAQQSVVPLDEAVGLGRGLVELDQVAVAAGGPAEVAEAAVQHLRPARDNADELAELLGLFHVVRAEDHGLALAGGIED